MEQNLELVGLFVAIIIFDKAQYIRENTSTTENLKSATLTLKMKPRVNLLNSVLDGKIKETYLKAHHQGSLETSKTGQRNEATVKAVPASPDAQS